MIELGDDRIARFRADGFLVIERLIDTDEVARLVARFEDLFGGRFETGLQPDEWNWRPGRDGPDLTRQICNAWKSDYTIAAVVLRAEIGRLCATLAGWPGARIAQDNVIWKPPGAKPLGFHQDDSYGDWIVPAEFTSCWIALDDTSAAGGTIEYARGSHRWGRFPPMGAFHGPDDYRAPLREAAARVGRTPDIVPVEVRAGDCVIHAGGTWHGSGTNRGRRPRRSVVSHCIHAEARFHPTNVGYIYNRYKRVGDEEMDESFFPVLWTRDGYRTPFLDDYMCRGSAAQATGAKADLKLS